MFQGPFRERCLDSRETLDFSPFKVNPSVQTWRMNESDLPGPQPQGLLSPAMASLLFFLIKLRAKESQGAHHPGGPGDR